MDPQIIGILAQWPMVAVMFFLYMAERSENKKIVEQSRTDSLRHEEIVLRLAGSMGNCPIVQAKVGQKDP